ncbi:MAG TPA: hypothetical protein VFE51_16300 [Verrucomicrobiae bacterium]|nr:hypothetical protein [Verrucomicrobiae bacterium]
MTDCQTEFSLSVAVCAWCKPRERGGALGAISHGICLRHLRKLKLEVQGLLPARRRRSVSGRSRNPDRGEGLLAL